ncbi:MAG: transposase, partial [Oscillospiraceae bacterium]
IAVDGSAFQVPNNTYSYYGGQKSQGEPQAMAEVCMLYDVINETIIKADIDKYIANEREQALKMIKQLDHQEQNNIFVFDRGFPSRKLLAEIGTKSKYLFRVSKQFMSAVNNATEADQIVQISDENGEAMQLRVINILLSTGETEKLLTNIFDFSPDFFEKMYALRWGIECNYKSLKSILQIENFTSGYPILIEQDFYATVLIANFLSISINETNHDLSEKLKDKDYKNGRKINYKAAFSILKPIFIQALCESNPEIAAALLEEAQLEILNFTSVVRPNRSFQRKKKHSAAKFNFSTK